MTQDDGAVEDTGPVSGVPTRRGAKRKKVYKSARLVMHGGVSTVDCILRDISRSGARLRLPAAMPVGGSVGLQLPDGETLQADVIRCSGLDVGLRFSKNQVPSLAPPPELIVQILFKLESPWLSEVLTMLESSPAHEEADIREAADDLREAYERLKAVVESHVQGV
jgi:hypothetical protein